MKKTIFISIVLLSSTFLLSLWQIKAAGQVYTCTFSQPQPGSPVLVVSNDGNFTPQTISISITCTGTSSYDPVCSDPNNRRCGYYFSYTPSNSDRFRVNLAEQGGSRSTTVNFSVSQPGQYEFVLQPFDNSVIVARGSVSVTADYSAISQDYAVYTQGCTGLPSDTYNYIDSQRFYYTCLVGGNGRGIVGGGDNYNRCGAVVPSATMCENLVAPNGKRLPGGSAFCLPCDYPEFELLPDGAACNPSERIVFDGLAPSTPRICNPNTSLCLNVDGENLCVRQDSKLQAGDECLLGVANQCSQSSPVGVLSCQEAAEVIAPIGKCQIITAGTSSCVGDLDCQNQNGGDERYKCRAAGGIYSCVLESGGIDPVDPGEGNGVTVTPTNGACNCPGASITPPCNPNDPQIEDSRNSEPGLGGDQGRFRRCVNCVQAGNTWTDSLGCVETTASGLFTRILQIALGVVGGITLLRLIIFGYQYNFSDKKADIKTAAKDVIATLGGLLLILFSVVLLRIIGVNILDIVPPGFFGT